jgi:hypothetical protein
METYNEVGEPRSVQVLLSSMKNDVKFGELRRLLIDLGFSEASGAEELVFRHPLSDVLFVFRRYRPGDRVAEYNLLEVQRLLDARGLMAADTFESHLAKTPA